MLSLLLILTSCSEQPKQPAGVPAPGQPQTTVIPQRPRLPENIDKSPMDIIYLPVDFPVLKMTGKLSGLPIARIIYSRPSKDQRVIFGNVVRYGSYWRLGANEATELELFRDVRIGGQPVKKGRYIMYCIPQPEHWTIVLNNDLYTWGLNVHKSGDLYKLEAEVRPLNGVMEVFTMEFREFGNSATLLMGWDNVQASLEFSY